MKEEVMNLATGAVKSILRDYNSDNYDVPLKFDNFPLTQADEASHIVLNNGLGKYGAGAAAHAILNILGYAIHQLDGQLEYKKQSLLNPDFICY
jgi:3'-phosphoadenosine 5'-phosphosulfate (PAPS) 3'-phosphatase